MDTTEDVVHGIHPDINYVYVPCGNKAVQLGWLLGHAAS